MDSRVALYGLAALRGLAWRKFDDLPAILSRNPLRVLFKAVRDVKFNNLSHNPSATRTLRLSISTLSERKSRTCGASAALKFWRFQPMFF